VDERDLMLDGNALGGVLAEIFAVEMTAAVGTCGSCGAHEQMARLHVYVHAPGVVVRCPVCGSVLMRVVKSDGRAWVELSGLRSLELRL
jgi:Zn finger protein HypA/HybF involved in hydrogenase expression